MGEKKIKIKRVSQGEEKLFLLYRNLCGLKEREAFFLRHKLFYCL